MTSQTAVLAEDEPVLREELKQKLMELWPELKVVGMACTGVEALQMLDTFRPDLLFLDIEMPGLSGLEVARQAQGRCHVVFVTAYDAHALAAFEAGAIDYVLKPIVNERLKLAIARVKDRLRAPAPNMETLLRELARSVVPREYLRWINAAVGDSVQLVTVNEVIFFQADSKYTRLVTPTFEALIRKPLADLQKELDPEMFWQVHRGAIVNVGEIHSVHRSFKGTLEIRLKRCKETLAVSASYAHRFKQL